MPLTLLLFQPLPYYVFTHLPFYPFNLFPIYPYPFNPLPFYPFIPCTFTVSPLSVLHWKLIIFNKPICFVFLFRWVQVHAAGIFNKHYTQNFFQIYLVIFFYLIRFFTTKNCVIAHLRQRVRNNGNFCFKEINRTESTPSKQFPVKIIYSTDNSTYFSI